MSLACLTHVNFLLHMYFDLITEQINDDDDDNLVVQHLRCSVHCAISYSHAG